MRRVPAGPVDLDVWIETMPFMFKRRPSLFATVFPIVAFVAGVMVGRYLPIEWLPGPEPGAERVAPTPGEVFSGLWSEFRGLADSDATAGDDPTTVGQASRPATHAQGEADASTAPTASERPHTEPTRVPPAMTAEQATRFVREPLLIVGVRDARTLELQNAAGARHPLRLAGIESRDPRLAQQLTGFVGYYAIAELATPPVTDGVAVATMYVQLRGWQPGQAVLRTSDRSLNAAVGRAIRRLQAE